eukprot:5159348-Pleurochrysis_carterae.AAC.1
MQMRSLRRHAQTPRWAHATAAAFVQADKRGLPMISSLIQLTAQGGRHLAAVSLHPAALLHLAASTPFPLLILVSLSP